MLPLHRPPYSANEVFETCISRVRDRGLKRRLEAALPAIISASDDFDRAAGLHSQHQIIRSGIVLPDVTIEEMGEVYSIRMVKKGSPGRGIYDRILAAAPNGKCPLCGQRPAATLDHHLPKSFYPGLAVSPLNLVPACSDCNKAKAASFPNDAANVFLHPYYDDVQEDLWLRARLLEAMPSSLQFYVDAPFHWDATLTSRVEKHFSVLGLGALYASEAAEELLNIRHQLHEVLRADGIDAVRDELALTAESCLLARQNSWRAASYLAWSNSDWFCSGGFLLD